MSTALNRSRYIHVAIDLDRIRANAEAIRAKVGVPIIAVIKSDAYGLGALRIADVLRSVVDDFAYFAVDEARAVGLPGLVLGPANAAPEAYRELALRPTVSTLAEADRYRDLPMAANIDTGMQRFGALNEVAQSLLDAPGVTEAFSHGTHAHTASRLREAVGRRALRCHAACSAMLDDATTWLDAVRPGLALYRGAVRVTTRLTYVRDVHGPAGYTGFEASRIGLFPAGYAEGLAPGIAIVNGRRQRIVEVNMNATYVTLDPSDGIGSDVVLLGDTLTEDDVADHWRVRPHEVLCRMTAMGRRDYGPARARSSVSLMTRR